MEWFKSLEIPYIIPSGPYKSLTNPGSWYTYPSEKYEFISWNDDIPNISGKSKVIFQTTNQSWLRGGMPESSPSFQARENNREVTNF
jgi:hypothetical protein